MFLIFCQQESTFASSGRLNPFVCDITTDELTKNIPANSVDVVSMVFVLSALPPSEMPFAIKNISRILKPGGTIIFRDYAVGDLAQKRFLRAKEVPKLQNKLYVRADGTLSYFFEEEFLDSLIENATGGVWEKVKMERVCKTLENRYVI